MLCCLLSVCFAVFHTTFIVKMLFFFVCFVYLFTFWHYFTLSLTLKGQKRT